MLESLRNLGRSEHEWVEESLSAYIDSELSAQETARVEKHLQECQACAENLATLRETVALLKELPSLSAPRSFAVRPAPVRPKTRTAAPGWGYGLLKGATALAALLLVVLISGDLALRFAGGFRLTAPGAVAPAAEVALAPSASPAMAPLEAEKESVVGEGKTEETSTEEAPPMNAQEPPLPSAAATEAPEAYHAPSAEDATSPVPEWVEGAEPEGTPTAEGTPLGPSATEEPAMGGPGLVEPVATPMPATTPSPSPPMESAELAATPTPTATPEVVAMAEVPDEEAQALDEAHVQAEPSLVSPLRLAELIVFSFLLLLIFATLLTGWLIRKRGV